jgi:hypothetical protein
MTSPAPTRVLVVAHQTAATPRLLDEVRARARRSPCTFTLVVPRPYWDPETDAAATTLELAIPLLSEAAGGHVEGIVGDTDPFVAVEQAVERGGFDEIIISTLPARVSRWLRRDLPHRVEALGLAVTVVTAQQSDRAEPAAPAATSTWPAKRFRLLWRAVAHRAKEKRSQECANTLRCFRRSPWSQPLRTIEQSQPIPPGRGSAR